MIRTTKQRYARAFTLMEVLFAVTLSAMILLLAVQFLLALSQNWADRDEDRYFQEHVDGLLRFFESTLRQNAYDPRLPTELKYPALDRPPGMSNLQDPMLRIHFPDGAPLFFHGAEWTGPVTAWFGFLPDTGVFALWRPDFHPEMEDYRDFFQVLITPWAHDLKFYYYEREDDRWEEEDEVRLDSGGQPQFPDRVKAVFRYRDDVRKEALLTLPRSYSNVFVY